MLPLASSGFLQHLGKSCPIFTHQCKGSHYGGAKELHVIPELQFMGPGYRQIQECLKDVVIYEDLFENCLLTSDFWYSLLTIWLVQMNEFDSKP